MVDGEDDADEDEDEEGVCDASAEAADLIAPAPDCTPPMKALRGLTLDVVACPVTLMIREKVKSTAIMICRCNMAAEVIVSLKITATIQWAV